MFTEPKSREEGRVSSELSATGYGVLRRAAPREALAAIEQDLAPHFGAAPFESRDPAVSRIQPIGANCTAQTYRFLTIGFCSGWVKPAENLWLGYPPHAALTFSAELAALVGYRRHFSNFGNFEYQCPSVLPDPRRNAEFDIGDIPRFEVVGAPAGRGPLP